MGHGIRIVFTYNMVRVGYGVLCQTGIFKIQERGGGGVMKGIHEVFIMGVVCFPLGK